MYIQVIITLPDKTTISFYFVGCNVVQYLKSDTVGTMTTSNKLSQKMLLFP